MDIQFDEASLWEDFQAKDKTTSTIQFEWGDTNSERDTQCETADNDAQRVKYRYTRTRQAPSRFSDYQIYSDDNNSTEGDIV